MNCDVALIGNFYVEHVFAFKLVFPPAPMCRAIDVSMSRSARHCLDVTNGARTVVQSKGAAKKQGRMNVLSGHTLTYVSLMNICVGAAQLGNTQMCVVQFVVEKTSLMTVQMLIVSVSPAVVSELGIIGGRNSENWDCWGV